MFTICLLQCRSTISGGIRRKNPHQTSLDFAASWPSSASEYMLDVNSSYAVCHSALPFVSQVPSYMSSQLAVNVSPLAWMTSQQQRGCNGMVMLLEHQIGQKQAVLWPLHWYAFSPQLACHFSWDMLRCDWARKKKILILAGSNKHVLDGLKLNLLDPKGEACENKHNQWHGRKMKQGMITEMIPTLPRFPYKS